MIATLQINLSNIKHNWSYLNKLSGKDTQTSAVLKANAYGLGVREIAPILWEVGAKSFFVATVEEAVELTKYLPKNSTIYTLNGYDDRHKTAVDSHCIIPVLNSPSQLSSFLNNHSRKKACLQIDVGMRRLGFQTNELKQCHQLIKSLNLDLIIGHLSCADDAHNPSNNISLQYFKEKTSHFPNVKRSISASHGILLGQKYNFDVTRPGIALYGGVREKGLLDVINIQLPVLQIHYLEPGEGVGYGLTYIAKDKKKVATLFGGYADGIMRNLSQNGFLYYGKDPCPILGRISMDLITVDITHLRVNPDKLTLLGKQQTINDLADKAGTITHEILTNIGSRFSKSYIN